MNNRMDKYKDDTPELQKRTVRNQSLYRSLDVDDYNKFDVNSNVSVLKDNARSIDLDQIRDMLDKKYRSDAPKRKSIDITDEPVRIKDEEEDTKEYDLNNIISKARKEKSIDYEVERLNRAYSGSDLVNKVNEKYNTRNEEEATQINDLMNTITQLELKNQSSDAELLNLGEDDTSSIEAAKEEPENDFYTGNLKVTESDYDDFKDMEKDIKSNSTLIKILVFLFILIIIGVGVILANNFFDLGLF